MAVTSILMNYKQYKSTFLVNKNMKYIQVFSLLTFITNLSFGQIDTNANQIENDTAKIIYDTYKNQEDLEQKKAELGIKQLTYVDSTFNFKVTIPEWYNVIETDTPYILAGTLPAVEGIENAIAIKPYKKSENSFEEFEEYVVKHMIFGGPVRWSETHLSMGKNELDEYKEIGKSYKVYLMRYKLLYHCQYVLVETKTAFLWIDYTATQETFDKNKDKFDEFMSGFEVMQ